MDQELRALSDQRQAMASNHVKKQEVANKHLIENNAVIKRNDKLIVDL